MMNNPRLEIFMLADLHLKENDPLGVGIGLANTRTQKKFEILERAVEMVVGSKARDSMMVLLGDIFDSPRIPEELRAKFFQIIGRIIRDGRRVIYIADNHTRMGSTNPFVSESLVSFCESAVETGGKFRMIHAYGLPDNYRGWSLNYVPFGEVADVEHVLGVIAQHEPSNVIVFGHWPLRLFQQTDTHQAETGVDPKLLEPFHSVFLGDFHLHQGSTDHYGIGFKGYVGSAVAASFGEVAYPHQICKLTLGEYPDYEIKWIDSGDNPIVQLEIEKDEFGEDPAAWTCTQGTTTDVGHIPSDALVKVIFAGTRQDLASLDMRPWLDQISKFNPAIVRTETRLVDGLEPQALSELKEFTHSPEQLIKEYSEGDEEKYRVGTEIWQSLAE